MTEYLIALLINGYFGVYKEMWTYAEPINMLGVSILSGAVTYEYYLKKMKKWKTNSTITFFPLLNFGQDYLYVTNPKNHK